MVTDGVNLIMQRGTKRGSGKFCLWRVPTLEIYHLLSLSKLKTIWSENKLSLVIHV